MLVQLVAMGVGNFFLQCVKEQNVVNRSTMARAISSGDDSICVAAAPSVKQMRMVAEFAGPG
jgi:hypothetical protein